jgi:hypothetical protein
LVMLLMPPCKQGLAKALVTQWVYF